jgi:hypothetical protein
LVVVVNNTHYMMDLDIPMQGRHVTTETRSLSLGNKWKKG